MIICEYSHEATFPLLEEKELQHREEMRQQAIALMYGWA